MISLTTFCRLHATSMWNCVSSGAPRRRVGPPMTSSKRLLNMRMPWSKLKKRMSSRNVPSSAMEIELLDSIDVSGLAVGGEAHDLVFGAVDLEAQVPGESAVQQAQAVREADLALQLDLVVPAHAPTRRGPFANTVNRQDRRLGPAAGIKRTGRMREVVATVEDGSAVAQFILQHLVQAKLGAEPGGHALHELGQAFGEGGEVADQQPLELEHGLVVEGDGAEVLGPESRLAQRPAGRIDREVGIVLLPRESLFVGGGDRNAVDQQAGRGVVVEAGQAQDVHAGMFTQGCSRRGIHAGMSRQPDTQVRRCAGCRGRGPAVVPSGMAPVQDSARWLLTAGPRSAKV